jgi:hypothetical protein
MPFSTCRVRGVEMATTIRLQDQVYKDALMCGDVTQLGEGK